MEVYRTTNIKKKQKIKGQILRLGGHPLLPLLNTKKGGINGSEVR